MLQRLSYCIPLGLAGLFSWLAKPSWWAFAMVITGLMFAWDWLWGDRRLLSADFGLSMIGIGLACLVAAWLLAHNLGISLGEFQQLSSNFSGRSKAGLLYRLPGIGVGFLLYGLLIWSRAWQKDREDSF